MILAKFLVWLFALSLGSIGVAVASPVFNFTFAIGPNTGYGNLDTVDQGGGVFWATSGSLTVTGGLDIGTYALGAGGPVNTSSPSGAFGFDNLLYPSLNPHLDQGGLFFTGNDLEINILGIYDPPDPGTADDYIFISCIISIGCNHKPKRIYNVRDEDPNAHFAVTVPEPATLALLGLGLAGLGFSRRKQ